MWYQFCVEKQDIIKKLFRKVGLFLPIDSSTDCELNIKGFTEPNIRDWRRVKVTSSIVNTGLGLDTSLDEDLDQQDLWYVDVNTKHDNCSVVEFVADGE